MAIGMHSRVIVMKPGPWKGFAGSVTRVYPNGTDVDVVLDDGRAREEGGTLPPAPPVMFAKTELAE